VKVMMVTPTNTNSEVVIRRRTYSSFCMDEEGELVDW
jgi:hypothetical protein